MWVGQTSTATDGITEINLANTSHMGMQNLGGNVGGYFVRQNNNVLTNARIETFFGGANVISSPGIDPSQIGEGNRMNIIKYETPTYAGFIASAAFGEDDMWDVALRYAGEHQGFKLAFGVGYQQWTDGNVTGSPTATDERDCVAGLAGGGADRKCSQLGLSGAVMHVDSGVYLHGAYGIRWDELSRVPDKTSDRFYLQGGIEKNWFGLGKTTLFAEGAMYSITDTGATFGNGPSVTATGILASHTSMWGLGLNQSIDAAAMDLYVNYQHYDFDANVCNASVTSACAVGLKDFQAVIAGGIIRF